MSLKLRSWSRMARTGLLLGCAGLVAVASFAGAKKGPIKQLKFDPKAEQVELFEAIEAGQIEAKVIAKSSKEANVFIENKTDKPLTIKVPKAVVAVQVLKQGGFGQGLGAGGNQAAGGNNNNQQGGQPMGGGMMGGMGGMMGGMGGMGGGMMGGMGMFSVPAEKIVQVPMKGVCLVHGKAEPTSRMNYKLMPLEDYTSDKALQEMVTSFATTDMDQGAAQAAIWNIANKMSWSDLANKGIPQVGLPDEPYFTAEQLQAAQQLVVNANGLAQKRQLEEEKNPPKTRKPARVETSRTESTSRP